MKFEQTPQNNNQMEADPTAFSPLESSIKFNHQAEKRGDVVVDENTGTEYILISGERADADRKTENVEIELFICLLSKGILHVSDIVEKNGKFYSKIMPLENIKPGEKMELEAEKFILSYIFSDWDREILSDDKELSKFSKPMLGKVEEKNLIRDKKGAFAHFDHDVALGNHHNMTNVFDQTVFMFRSNDSTRHSGIPIEKALTIDKIKGQAHLDNQSIIDKFKGFFSGRNTQQLVKILNEKVELFENQINNKSFFDSVVEKSKLNIHLGQFYFLDGETVAEKEESLRKYFLERLEILKRVIKK